MNVRLRAALVAVAAAVCMAAAIPSLVRSQSPSIVVINLSSGPEDLHAAWMGLSLAKMSVEEKRDVVVFLNVRAPVFASRSKGGSYAFHRNPRMAATLAGLAGRGVRIIVCPLCMRELGIEADDLIEAADVATKQTLFEKLRENTVVFSY